MIRNYFKIALRNITTKKFYTFLNISGLAIAISCCIFIYLYTSYNLSFDTYHKQSKNIFRLVYNLQMDKMLYDKGSAYATYMGLKTEVPQVQQAAFSVDRQTLIVNINPQKRFKEESNISFTNADWFKLFSFQFIAGSANGLNSPYNAVLRKSIAEKYFGNADAIGKVLIIDNHPLKVVGVIADAPYNTDLKSEIYLSFSSLAPLVPIYGTDKYFLTDMGNLSSKHSTFVVLNNAKQQNAVEKEIINVAKRHRFGYALKYYTFKLLPLSDVHFDTRYEGVVQRSLLWNLAIIGLLIISIAVFNYINLTIAQQTRRAAEIATRKVLGGSAVQIFMQFITESLITSAIAAGIALLLVLLLLPLANLYLFVNEPLHIISYLDLSLFVGLVMLCVTIGTGVYPAWILSRVSIAQALKSHSLNLSAGIGRKVMVVFQNTVTQSLMICTLIIVLQVHFLKNTDVGFNRKSVITIPVGKLSDSQKEQLNHSLTNIPAVQAFSLCYRPPSVDTRQSATVQYNNQTKWEKWPALFAIGDSAYCKTFGLRITVGRDIRNNQPKPEYLVNETMAAMLEKQDPTNVIGKTLSAGDQKGTIVGIVKGFSVKSLVNPIQPTVVLEDKNLQTNLAVKLSGDRTSAVINTIQQQYQRILPDQLFAYQFVDEQLANLYKIESIQQKLILAGASVAIFISSLGLLGLVSLIALQRTKEVGIRKVLGATVTQISVMLSGDFLKMVLFAFLIAAPASWWAMNKWLQGFAYRIDMHWWTFALAGGIAVVIAIISVSFQSIKTAIANPVKSLKSE
jgi:putative ABC transport system permease protein